MGLGQFPHIFRGELGVSVRFALRAAMSLKWPATPPPVVMHCTKATRSIFAIAALDPPASGQPFWPPHTLACYGGWRGGSQAECTKIPGSKGEQTMINWFELLSAVSTTG